MQTAERREETKRREEKERREEEKRRSHKSFQICKVASDGLIDIIFVDLFLVSILLLILI
jgi:hypothetical protein